MIELPEGFTAAGVACGLKPSGGLDLRLLVSDRQAASAGVFTANRVKAAPVVLSRRRVRRGRARAIVVNAGNANACTGARGMADARAMAATAARALGIPAGEALVASTGIIGVPLDLEATRRGIRAAAGALGEDGSPFARAIMTTDTAPKVATVRGDGWTITGFAKGAGMIAPEMATMLAFVVSDAAVSPEALASHVRSSGESFNTISVDGCMSTNDCLLALANGARGDPGPGFPEALSEVCRSLARQIVEDGEGATKVVTVRIEGAATDAAARQAARAVAGSLLLRCALNGADPNWGRVLAALGASRAPFDPGRVDVWLGGQKLCESGAPGPGDVARAAAALRERQVEVRVELNRGDASALLLTNDLSVDYVRINAEYTT